MNERVLRLFVSSPGDVMEERRRVDLVVERLNAEFRSRVRIETIRWETAYYAAHDTFQNQIPEACDCDVVIAVFRARLGTPLPNDFRRLPSGEAYPSGTAYEVLSAIEARRSGKPLPDVFVFRFPGAPAVPLDAPERADIEAQWDRLKNFFQTWFRRQSGEFVAAFQNYSSTDNFAEKVETCLRQWLAQHGFLPQGAVWDRLLRGSPFPGLSAFEADRHTVFFGRGLAIRQAVDRLREAGTSPNRLPFMLLIGASGSGKSSLLRAGLLLRLTSPGAVPEIDMWRAAVVAPGPDPFLSLAEGLFADAALGQELQQGSFRTAELLGKQLRGDPETALAPVRDALGRAAERRRIEATFDAVRPTRLALAIDQTERLFVESDAETARAFAALLSALVWDGLAFVVLALRSDVYPRFQSIDALVALRDAGATFDLLPPTAAELEEIVTRPVAACHPPLAFEYRDGRSLAAQLVGDAKGGDALPLLQMTLSRLYAAEQGRKNGLLQFSDYRGLDAAVTETANEALDTLSSQARDELPALVTALVADVAADPVTGVLTPVVNAIDRPSFEALNPARRMLVEAFVAKRLLTAEGDATSEQVRPVHEALLRIWPQAEAIVRENAALIRVRHALEPIVREWAAATKEQKPRHLEVSPALLDGAQQLVERFGQELTPTMRDFIAQAVAMDAARRDRERQEQERRLKDAQDLAKANRRIAQRTGAGLAFALALAAVAGWQWWVAQTQTGIAQTQTQIARTQAQIADTQSQRAEQSARDADTQRDEALQAGSRALAALADQRIEAGDVSTGALLALDAAGRHAGRDVDAALVNSRLHLREFAVLDPLGAGATVLSGMTATAKAPLSVEGEIIVTALDSQAHVWRSDSGKHIAVLAGHTRDLNEVTISPDGKRVATASDDATARIWEATTGASLAVLRGHTGPVSVVVFSPDGTKVVTGSADRTARIWDASSGKPLAVLSHTAEVNGITFSPDGKLLLTWSADNSARTWRADGTAVARIFQQNELPRSGRFSSDSKRVAIGFGASVVIADAYNGKTLLRLNDHVRDVISLEFIPGTNHVLTGSIDQTARIWDAGTGATVAILAGHRGGVFAVATSRDGRSVVTASTDGTARVWDASNGRLIAILAGHNDWVMKAAFTPDAQRIVTAGRDGTARLWADDAISIGTGRTGSAFRLWRAAISPDGRYVAAPSSGDTARLWNAQTGKVVAILEGHTGTINAVAFDPSGQRVATTSEDGTARLWEARTGRQLAVLSGHTGAVVSIGFSPDGKRIVTGSGDKTLRTWDGETGNLLLTIVGHEGTISSTLFSSDSKRIVSASPIDSTVRLWDAETGQPAGPGIIARGQYYNALFSPDGQRILLTHIDVAIIDATTGDRIASFPGFGERVVAASYSPDGRYLLFGSLDGTARIWNADNGRPVALLRGSGELGYEGVYTVAMSGDGRRLLVASGRDSLRVHESNLRSDELVADLKSATPRCLTPAERVSFNLDAILPDWCFQLGKWPYASSSWQIWYRHREDTDKPPRPDQFEWFAWIGKKSDDLRTDKPAEALVYLQEAGKLTGKMWTNLLKSSSDETGSAAARYSAYVIRIGQALKALGRSGEARVEWSKAVDVLAEAINGRNNRGLQDQLAYAHELIAESLANEGKTDESIREYRQWSAVLGALAAAEPDNEKRQAALAAAREKLGQALLDAGQLPEALTEAREGLALRRKLLTLAPADSDRLEDVAYALRLLGDILRADGKRPEALAAFRESAAIRQRLVDADPENFDRLNAVAFVDLRLASTLLSEGSRTEAIVFCQHALSTRLKLASMRPDEPSRKRDVGAAYVALAEALQEEGQGSDALARYRDALAAYDAAAVATEREEIAKSGKPGVATARILGNTGWAALYARDFEKALRSSQRAVDLAPDLLWIKTNLAHALMFLKRRDEARAIFLEFRGQEESAGRSWEKAVLGDFAEFRKAGLADPLMDEIEKLFSPKT